MRRARPRNPATHSPCSSASASKPRCVARIEEFAQTASSRSRARLRMKLPAIIFFLLCSLPSTPAHAQELTLPDCDSKPHAPLDSGGKAAVVLFFVSPFCPTTKSFMAEINQISGDHAEKARFFLIHSDPAVTPEVAFQHAEMSGVRMTVLLDTEQKLARHAGARVTPETVVFSPQGAVLYRGRVNDLYLGPTKRQRAATTRDLRDALEAVFAGRPVPEPQHEAQGCKISGIPQP
ncbi:MAG TPA: hypothetical protein DIT13_07475 [Verrucomicrobiales bacterium]|nr:hypothetical protein [Verrucomicrobiales bacterium]